MSRRTRVELAMSMEDWQKIRECFVKSFVHYPLYDYIVPDQSKREEFLRAYLDANYEVTVGSGKAILLGMWVSDNEDQLFPNLNKDNCKLVGGLILLFPSTTGRGWAIQNDEPYWQAYEKYKLADISEEGMRRVKKYEAWEHSTIAKKLLEANQPMWNGLFFALLPEYTSQGLVSHEFDKGVKLLSEAYQEQLRLQESRAPKSNPLPKKNSSTKMFIKKDLDLAKTFKSPLVIGICHGTQSVNFYKNNGFTKYSQTKFSGGGKSFTVTVFSLDIAHKESNIENCENGEQVLEKPISFSKGLL